LGSTLCLALFLMTFFNPVARFSSQKGRQTIDAASTLNADNTNASMPLVPALASKDLRKSYGRGKRRFEAVRGVSLSIQSGEVLAFLGPNGAGKTTTIKMIAGLIRPDAGWVKIAGADPHQQPQALKGVGAVLEGNRNLYWRLTPLENLEYFGVLRQMPRKIARQRGEQLLEAFGLIDKRNEAVQTLSRGMQQKIAIAVALIHQPSLLLLDEPTLGLDVASGETVKQLVRQVAAEGCAILLTTHQLNVAEELSDRVAVIRSGQIVAEQPTAELIQAFSDSATYDIEVDGQLTPDMRARVESLGALVDGHHIRYTSESAQTDIYKLLNTLAPLPLIGVQQRRADLTDVFLQLTGSRTEETEKGGIDQ